MDGFFGIGIQELILIAIVALIVLGPERLPATFREIAKFIRQVRNMTNEFTQQFGDDFKALEDLDPRRMLQQAINSIDEEEQAKENIAKGKSSTSSATAKPTPAKSTVAKTAADKPTVAKPATSTSKSTTTATSKPTPTKNKEDAAESQPSSVAPSASPASTAVTAETVAGQADISVAKDTTDTPDYRIAPPALEQVAQAQSNGTSNDVVATATGDVAHAIIPTNGAQDHPAAHPSGSE